MFHFAFSRISLLSPLFFSKQWHIFIVILNYALILTNCVLLSVKMLCWALWLALHSRDEQMESLYYAHQQWDSEGWCFSLPRKFYWLQIFLLPLSTLNPLWGWNQPFLLFFSSCFSVTVKITPHLKPDLGWLLDTQTFLFILQCASRVVQTVYEWIKHAGMSSSLR